MARTRLKRYLYISQTKVDLAFQQIEEPVLRRIAATLRFDLPPFGVSVGPKPSKDSLIKRLRVVVEHLERNGSIGTVESPRTYLRGAMSMIEADIGGDRPILLYAGRQAGTLVALTGSVSNAIGRREMEAVGSRRTSLDDAFEREIGPRAPKRTQVSKERAAREPYDLVAWIVRVRSRLAESVEFVAERSSVTERTDSDEGIDTYLVGSPLYVALAE